MDGATAWALGVAVTGAVLSIASLTWNVVAFLHSGPRVKVESTPDMVLIDPAQGLQTPVVTVTVRNIGRMPCQIVSWSLMTPSGSGLALLRMSPEHGPPLTYTLEPGHAESWRAPLNAVVDALRGDYEGHVQLVPMVWLGTGVKKKGPTITVIVD